MPDRVDGVGTLEVIDPGALTTVQERGQLHTMIYDVAAAWLAAGLDPARTILFRQSSVGEVFELS